MLRLRKALDSKRMTVKNCAALVGISEKSLYNKIYGANEFTYGEVKKLAAMFPDLNMDYYLSEDTSCSS